MSLMNLNKAAETETQPVFKLYNIPYYPHYSSKHKWVGPGHWTKRVEYTTTELVALGARLTTMQLWARSWTNEVKGWKIL
jgi:hypothetical protein